MGPADPGWGAHPRRPWGGGPVGVVGSGPRRLHALSPFLDVARFGLFILIVVGRNPATLVVLGLLVAVTTGIRYVAWSRFTYEVDATSLVTEGGIVNRTRRVVPLDRVQQVDLQRKLRHRAFGLAVVRIDTAGAGNDHEVTLDALSDAEAEELRAVLSDRPAPAVADAAVGDVDRVGHGGSDPSGLAPPVGVASTAAPAPPEREVISLGFGRLALGGITGSKLAMVFVAVGALIGLVDDLPGGLRDQAADSLADSARFSIATFAVLALLTLPLVIAVAAGAAVLADGGFRLTRRGDVLHVSRGLLDQRQASLAIHRVQVVRIHQNVLRRVLGLETVTLQSAGGSGQVEQQDSQVTVPILSASQLDALLAEVLPEAPRLPRLHPAPSAARRRAWVRRVVPALLVSVPVGLLFPPVGLLALLLIPAAMVGGELAYRGLGWASVDEHLVVRRGGLTRETSLVPVAKVQSTGLVSSPFQRRAGLATLRIDVAGRGRTPTVLDADADAMVRLRDQTGETTASRRDERAVRRQAARGIAAEVAR